MQPPSGGCVLKQHVQQAVTQAVAQPPSGGCVLKLTLECSDGHVAYAATFGWLCVETCLSCF